MIVEYCFSDSSWKKESSKGYCIGSVDNSFFSNGCDLEQIKTIQGSFAIVREMNDRVSLIVDTIASYPLFYYVEGERIIVSDDAIRIADRATHPTLDYENVEEFLKVGYVTEKETLFSNIYTVNPGTIVTIDKTTAETVESHWFDLNYPLSETDDIDYLVNRYDECMTEVFADLIKRLDGRPALIPLSGGCDSRTIAAFLKKLNYDNTVCFTYGKSTSWEVERSKTIAENLGFKWLYKEYTSDVWKSFFSSDEYRSFLDFSCRGRSIGCVQALPAIMEIHNKNSISEDAVVVPGHALDFSLGSHLSEGQDRWSAKQITQKVLEENYLLRDNQLSYGKTGKWEKGIDNDEPVNWYMNWEYRNRQAKFIANDVRTYEFAGFDYELPFWDTRVQEFVMGLPFRLLLNRSFQYELTQRIVDPIVGISQQYNEQTLVKKNVKGLLKRNVIIRKWIKNRNNRKRLDNDINGFLSWLDEKQYQDYSERIGKSFNLNSIIADDYINILVEKYNTNHNRE